MKNKQFFDHGSDLDRDCLGDYDMGHPLCHDKCVLRLRCAVVKEQLARLEIIEELTADMQTPPIIQ